MRCPFCHTVDQDRVLDSRPVEGGESIRRRRECEHCQRRFTTYERIEEVVRLTVVKKDGSRVPFDRDLVLTGIQKACYKRPISAEVIAKIVDAVEEQVVQKYQREVPSSFIGEQVMQFLRQTDPIAYVRFASVYRQFRDLGELVDEARDMMEQEHSNDPDQTDLFSD
ncbi:MAG: transcriptional regulator NrdR [Phycisphaerae bacterium]